MGGSQLSQLKAALHSSGATGQQRENRKKKSNSNVGRSKGIDEDARKAKLESIRQSMNRFDVKTTKTKHHIVNAKPTKGATGRPGLSKQVGIDNRRKTLLPQWLDRNRTGAVVDRRFGEDNPDMTPEEKALERFTFERQRKASKSSLFNLGDNDDNEGLGGQGSTPLTHYGKDIDDIRGPLADQEDLFHKSKTTRVIPELHEVMPEDTGRQRKKSKAEVMEEVIAKSKAYKYERQRQSNADEEMRHALDDELSGIRSMLGAPNRREEYKREQRIRPAAERPISPPPAILSAGAEEQEDEDENDNVDEEHTAPIASTSKTTLTFIKPIQPESAVDRSLLAGLIGDDDDAEVDSRPKPPSRRTDGDDDVLASLARLDSGPRSTVGMSRDAEEDDDPYDRFVRELAFEKRAAPSDRLKSETEAALEAAESLRRSEAARLKRMRGSDDEDSSDEEGIGHRSRKSKKGKESANRRRPEGDDLGVDYEVDGDEVSGFSLGLGAGLEEADGESQEEEADSDDEEEDSDEEEGESDENSDEEVSEDDFAETEMLADLLHRDAEVRGLHDVDDEASSKSLVTKKAKSKKSGPSTLPYTFPCPASHDEFLDLVTGHEDQLPTIVERIRTLYHPSLAEGNKEKLALFLGVLIDHLIYEAANPSGSSHLSYLAEQVFNLTQMFPISSASFFVAKLKTMQRNLLLGLQAGPGLSSSRTWPGPGEVSLLRIIGLLWSTSDFAHPVGTPASLLLGQYLAQCRVRNLRDIATGLVLCSISLQYETFSKRLFPEVVNFISKQLPVLVMGCSTIESSESYSKFPVPEQPSKDLLNQVKVQASLPSTSVDILAVLRSGKIEAITREHICFNALTLATEIFARQTSLLSFIECFMPLAVALDAVTSTLPTSALKTRALSAKEGLDRAMRLSKNARRPLTLQSHKPVPIPTYVPKFDAGYAPGRRFDPDSERNEASKLKALVKKERKGAIRELRKDSRFLAGERAKMQAEKDSEYKSKIDKITAGLQEERHEEKRFERTKERETMRDKKRAGGGGGGGGRGGKRK